MIPRLEESDSHAINHISPLFFKSFMEHMEHKQEWRVMAKPNSQPKIIFNCKTCNEELGCLIVE